MVQNLRFFIYLLIIHTSAFADLHWQEYESANGEPSWQGDWFPYKPSQEDTNPSYQTASRLSTDPVHGIAMGIADKECDDGKVNLEVDWDMNPVNYTCFDFNDKRTYRSRSSVESLEIFSRIPEAYNAQHICMNSTIEYDSLIPTFGPHRPLWAKYGEYTFVPKQRWVHNLEHGAIVMLYHPCADRNEVNLLRIIVRQCLYRHVITPYNLLTPERPLALVAWGKSLQMSKVLPEIAVNFIQENALKGTERTSKDGQYDLMLIRHAEILNDDIDDNQICTLYNYIQ